MTVTRQWRPGWLLVSAVGALIAYRTASDYMAPCNCLELRLLLRVIDVVFVPFGVAGLLVITGVAGSLGSLDGLLRFVHLRAVDVSRVARHRRLWPVVATAVGLSAALVMLSGRPNLVGLVPLAGVLTLWVGLLARKPNVTSVGVLVGLGSGVLIFLWLLLLLVAFLQVRI